MKELEELLGMLTGNREKKKLLELCANYEREISLIQRQYQTLRNDLIAIDRVNRKKVYSITKRVWMTVRRYGECHLFYNNITGKFHAHADPKRIAKESNYSELVGVYTEGYDKEGLIGDIWQTVNAGSG